MAKNTTKTTAADAGEDKKNKTLQIKGAAVHPKLDRPYRYDKKTKRSVPDAEEGEYSVKVALPKKEASEYIKQIDAIAKAAGVVPAKAKNMPYAPETDKEGEETGRITFTCKGYATRRDGTPNKIMHWSAAGKPMPAGTRVGAGSLIRVDLWPKPFKELGGGVRLNINAVQVLKLEEYQARNPFGVDEEYADTAEENDTDETEDNEDGDTDADAGDGDGDETDF